MVTQTQTKTRRRSLQATPLDDELSVWGESKREKRSSCGVDGVVRGRLRRGEGLCEQEPREEE